MCNPVVSLMCRCPPPLVSRAPSPPFPVSCAPPPPGLMLKRLDVGAAYEPCKRSEAWIKVGVEVVHVCVCVASCAGRIAG